MSKGGTQLAGAVTECSMPAPAALLTDAVKAAVVQTKTAVVWTKIEPGPWPTDRAHALSGSLASHHPRGPYSSSGAMLPQSVALPASSCAP